MIARIWHGRTPASRADEYLRFLQDRAVPDYRSVRGNLAVFLLRRIEGEVAHFLTVTHWESLDAIRAFAGPEVDRARYYPEDSEFLLEFEPTVQHFELVSQTRGRITLDFVASREPPRTGRTDLNSVVVHPRLAGRRPTLFGGLAQHVDRKVVRRGESGSGDVIMSVR